MGYWNPCPHCAMMSWATVTVRRKGGGSGKSTRRIKHLGNKLLTSSARLGPGVRKSILVKTAQLKPAKNWNVQPKQSRAAKQSIYDNSRKYHDFITHGLFAIVHASSVFQNCATTDLSTCRRLRSIYTKHCQCQENNYRDCTCLQLRNVPVFDFCIWWVARRRHVEPFDYDR